MSIDTAGFWYGEGEGHRCGYCKNETTNISTGLYLSFISPRRYNALIDRGWRRSGMYLYKPSMEKTCCPQYTIKCNALDFRISRSQKKVLRNFSEFLQSSSPGSLPTFKRGQHTDIAQTSENRPNFTPSCETKFASDVKSACANVENGKTKDNVSSKGRQPKACFPAEAARPATFKTGAQLASSSKKRDFRRLRKLKKIAAERNISWEELDVRALGVQPDPPSLSERLSKAVANKRLEMKLIPIDTDDPESDFNKTFSLSHKVFQKYQMTIHNDSPEECREHSFKRFLCQPPFSAESEEGGYHQHYYIDGKLVAVGVLDLLPWCVSSVYLFYDPDYSALSFGTLSALFEIELVQQLNSRHPGVKWYYMGFYIHSCPKMKYKSKFSPSYLLCPRKYTWWPITDCQLKLDQQKFCVFDEKTAEESPPTDEQLGTLKVLYERRLCMYSAYKMLRQSLEEEDDYEDVLPTFVKLTGLENAQKICVYT